MWQREGKRRGEINHRDHRGHREERKNRENKEKVLELKTKYLTK
jgi:hypothetical protein